MERQQQAAGGLHAPWAAAGAADGALMLAP
jgi:hypothetical protein